MVREKFNLEGKVAVVNGAAGNIGSEVARTLAKAGADVAVTDFRAEPLEQTAADVRQLGRKSIALLADITDSRQVDRMVEGAIAEFGKVDILLNVAGIVRGEKQGKLIWDITDKEWYLGIDTNLSGAFFFCRAVGKHLVAQKSGKVINVASINGIIVHPHRPLMYQCAKAGVILLTRWLALNWAQDNVQVNCIAPGLILPPGDALEATLRRDLFVMGRWGTPVDIGSLALFLASDASNYVTGETFIADGGTTVAYGPSGYAPIITMEED